MAKGLEMQPRYTGDLTSYLYILTNEPAGQGNQKEDIFSHCLLSSGASLVAQMVKNLPAKQVWSLDWEDHLEKGMATHSSILARRIPWTEKPRGLQSMGSQRIRHN